jgi:hypothetical protein
MRHWCLTSTAGEHVELALGGRAVQQTIHFAGTQAVAQLSAKGGNCTANALLALTHKCGFQNINHKNPAEQAQIAAYQSYMPYVQVNAPMSTPMKESCRGMVLTCTTGDVGQTVAICYALGQAAVRGPQALPSECRC